jgi:hypothetical protein
LRDFQEERKGGEVVSAEGKRLKARVAISKVQK